MLETCGFYMQLFHSSAYQGCTIAQDVVGGFFVLFEEPLHSASEDKVVAAKIANKEEKLSLRDKICSLN